MPAIVAGIHVFLAARKQDVDGRDKPGHDGNTTSVQSINVGALLTEPNTQMTGNTTNGSASASASASLQEVLLFPASK
jgi:hypothetical protein